MKYLRGMAWGCHVFVIWHACASYAVGFRLQVVSVYPDLLFWACLAYVVVVFLSDLLSICYPTAKLFVIIAPPPGSTQRRRQKSSFEAAFKQCFNIS